MPHELNDVEIINVLNFPRYAPRLKPTPIPLALWDDAPLYRVCLNDEWVSHILGALIVLDQPDTWIGTDDEVNAARRQVNEIIAHFMECRVMSCCCDQPTVTNTQFNQYGDYQVSYDGGDTYVDDPNDARNQIPTLPPIVGDGSGRTKCDAATNGLEHLKDAQAGVSAGLSIGLSASALVLEMLAAVLVAIFLPGGAIFLVPLLVGLASALASVAPEVYNSMFTQDVWDKTLCVLYCHIGDDGTFTRAGFEAVVSDLKTKLPNGIAGGAAASMSSFVEVWGLNGLNYNCSYGNAADADCSSCDCNCDTSNWVIWNGIGTNLTRGSDVDGNFIELDSVFDGANFGGQAVCLTTNNPNICCQLGAPSVTSVPSTGTWFYDSCGEAVNGLGTVFPHSGLIPTGLANTVGHNSTNDAGTPFHIKWYFQ